MPCFSLMESRGKSPDGRVASQKLRWSWGLTNAKSDSNKFRLFFGLSECGAYGCRMSTLFPHWSLNLIWLIRSLVKKGNGFPNESDSTWVFNPVREVALLCESIKLQVEYFVAKYRWSGLIGFTCKRTNVFGSASEVFIWALRRVLHWCETQYVF